MAGNVVGTPMNWNSLLKYEDGKLYWKKDISLRVRKNALAGTKSDSRYKRIFMQGKEYKIHKIVYEMHNGLIPEGMVVDHINRDITDNRIENLRLVSVTENHRNKKGRGVYQLPSGRWSAKICDHGKQKHLGTFDTSELAEKAYVNEKLALKHIVKV